LPGVSIQIKGLQDGTTTDANGVFAINVSAKDTLVFSYVGFEKNEIAINNNSSIQVLMQPVNNKLQDVVVIGYGTVKKKDLTGSVVSVNTKEFSSLPVPNVGEAIEGKAAGVQVISSGAPGSNVTFRIRGTGIIRIR